MHVPPPSQVVPSCARWGARGYPANQLGSRNMEGPQHRSIDAGVLISIDTDETSE